MKAIHRLYQYIECKDIKPTRLEKEIGLSNGYLGTQLKREADLGEGVLNKIIDYCLDIDPEWLLTGNGSMLRDGQNRTPEGTLNISALNEHLLTVIKDKDIRIEEQAKLIGHLEERLENSHTHFRSTGELLPYDNSDTNPYAEPSLREMPQPTDSSSGGLSDTI